MVEMLPEDLFRLDDVIDSDQDFEQVDGSEDCFDLDMELDGWFHQEKPQSSY
jgi:hypothetical protein